MEFNATFIVSVLSFIIFTVVMNAILYKPIEKIVAERKKYIDATYDEAQVNSDKSKAILKDRDNKLARAGSDAMARMNYVKHEASSKKEEMTSKANEDAIRNLDSNREYFANATNEANDTLKNEVINLAQSISNKFLSSEEKIVNVDNDLIEKIMQG